MDNTRNKNSLTERRFFIKKTLFGAAALALAQFLPLGCSRSPGSVTGYDDMQFFDIDEAHLLSGIVVRMIPLHENAEEDNREIIIRLDRYFAGAYPEDQRDFKRLLTVFNNPVFVFLFSGSFRPFDRMSDNRKDEYLRGWMTSSWGFRRTAFQALKRLIMSMHYTRDESWPAIGYGGPLIGLDA